MKLIISQWHSVCPAHIKMMAIPLQIDKLVFRAINYSYSLEKLEVLATN